MRRTPVISFSDPLFFLPERSKELRHINLRDQYEAQGGDFAFLCFLALQARPAPSPLPRNERADFTQWEKNLTRFLAQPGQDPTVKPALAKALFGVRVALQASPVRQRLTNSGQAIVGRPSGPTRPTLTAATLAYEFRRRFGRPRYPSVLALLQKVAPQQFPAGYTVKALLDRLRDASPGDVEQFHADVTRAWSARPRPRHA